MDESSIAGYTLLDVLGTGCTLRDGAFTIREGVLISITQNYFWDLQIQVRLQF